MESNQHYFQFPIGSLNLGKPIDKVDDKEAKERMTKIIDYCVYDIGNSIYQRSSSEEIHDLLLESYDSEEIEYFETDEAVIRLGALKLGVEYHVFDSSYIVGNHSDIELFATRYGSQLCRIRTDIFFEVKEGRGLDWRQFATLCAVYTGIGRWAKSKLTYDRIGAMALGFNGQRQRDAHDALELQLTDRQTMHTVQQLKRRGFFVCASPNRRHVFYSHRLTLDELIEELATGGDGEQLTASEITERIQRRQAELQDS